MPRRLSPRGMRRSGATPAMQPPPSEDLRTPCNDATLGTGTPRGGCFARPRVQAGCGSTVDTACVVAGGGMHRERVKKGARSACRRLCPNQRSKERGLRTGAEENANTSPHRSSCLISLSCMTFCSLLQLVHSQCERTSITCVRPFGSPPVLRQHAGSFRTSCRALHTAAASRSARC